MTEPKRMNRKDFITKGGLAVAGATLAVSGLGTLLTACSPAEKPADKKLEVPTWPYTWTKLDTKVVADRAFAKYNEAG